MKKYVLISAFFFVCSFAINDAEAGQNVHAYNGSYCRGQSENIIDLFYDYFGVINDANAYQWVICPVIVDEVGNKSGTRSIRVSYQGNGMTTCIFYSLDQFGTPLQEKEARGWGRGVLKIPNITFDDYWGSYSMKCELPPYGRLYTIWLSEKD